MRKYSQTNIVSRPKIADGITRVKLYMLFIIKSITLLDNASHPIGDSIKSLLRRAMIHNVDWEKSLAYTRLREVFFIVLRA